MFFKIQTQKRFPFPLWYGYFLRKFSFQISKMIFFKKINFFPGGINDFFSGAKVAKFIKSLQNYLYPY
jgi:hypothetical protein